MYFIGLFIMTIGIALSVKSNLGVSPVSSIPYTMTCVWGIEMGKATIILHCFLVLLQIILLRKNFKALSFLQILVGIVFGCSTTFCNYLATFLPSTDNIIIRIVMVLISAVFVAVGIFFYLPADVMPLAGEGAMQAVSKVTGIEFSKVKIGFDCTMVAISTVTCLVCIHSLGSVGIGTVIAAILVGTLVGVLTKLFGKQRDALLHRCVSQDDSRQTHTTARAAVSHTQETADIYAKSAAQETPAFCSTSTAAQETSSINANATTTQESAVDDIHASTQKKFVITISREFGSGGREIGKLIADHLGFKYYDSELVKMAAEKSGYTAAFVEKNEQSLKNPILHDFYEWYTTPIDKQDMPKVDQLFEKESEIIREIAKKESCVIIGRLANFILKDMENVYNVFISADEESEAKRVSQRDGMTYNSALKKVRAVNKERAAHCSFFTKMRWSDVRNYDVVLKSDNYGIEKTAQMIEMLFAEMIANHENV